MSQIIEIKRKIELLSQEFTELLELKELANDVEQGMVSLSDEEKKELEDSITSTNHQVETLQQELNQLSKEVSSEVATEVIEDTKVRLYKIEEEIINNQEKIAELEELKKSIESEIELLNLEQLITYKEVEIDKLKEKKELIKSIQQLFYKSELDPITDLQYLALADLVYEDFSKFNGNNGGIVLNDIFNDNSNFKSKREDTKSRWRTYRKHVGDWMFLKAYNPKELLTGGKEELTLEEEQFYAAAFQHPDKKRIVITYRGTDGDNGAYDRGKTISGVSVSQSIPILKELIPILAEKITILKKKLNIDPDFLLEHLVTNRKIAVDTPGRQFELAKEFYEKIQTLYNDNISFTGHSLGGGLAQYAAVISSSKSNLPTSVKNTVTWNGIGIKAFSKIMGYEFFDEYISIAQRLRDISGEFAKDHIPFIIYTSLAKSTLNSFEEKGYIRDGEITDEFLNIKGEIDTEKIKEVITPLSIKRAFIEFFKELIQIVGDIGDILKTPVIGVLKFIFNRVDVIFETLCNDDGYNIFDSPKNIQKKLESKRRFATYYQSGDKFEKRVVNYINSLDLTGNFAQHIGSTYVVDKELKIKDAESLLADYPDIEGIEFSAQHGFDVFYPFILLEEEGQVGDPKNRYGETAKVGDITTNLSYDYLRSIVKTIFLDITDAGKKKKLLKKFFKSKAAGSNLKAIKAALANSAIFQERNDNQTVEDVMAESKIMWLPYRGALVIIDGIIPDISLTSDNLKYKLDTTILANLAKMTADEINSLWKWESSEEQAYLTLGTEDINESNKTIYHVIDEDAEEYIDNSRQNLSIELEQGEASTEQSSNTFANKTTQQSTLAKNQKTTSLSGLIKSLINQELDELNVALPAKIEKYYPKELKAEVTLLAKKNLEGQEVVIPPLLECPVKILKAGPFIIRPPYQKGDIVQVLFNQRALDKLLITGEPASVEYTRRHALDDAVIIGGLKTDNQVDTPDEELNSLYIANTDTNSRVFINLLGDIIANNETHQVELIQGSNINISTENKVNINCSEANINSGSINLGNNATESVVLGDSFAAVFENHTHPYSWGHNPGSGDTSPPSSKVPLSSVTKTE